jgi:phosphomannomutase
MLKINDEYKLINGNELGVLFTYYVLNNKKTDDKSYVVKSIVSTPIIEKIAVDHNIKCYNVLTGCKNIANKRNTLTNENYIFGFEESLGYMFDINVNDKNGFSSMLSLLEIVCYCKKNNITLNDYILNIYNEYGYYLEETLSFVYPGLDGKDIINNFMENFRNKTITFENTKNIIDYSLMDNELKTNALKFELEDNSWIIVRPSGTEPKIKIYLGVTTNNIIASTDKLNNLKEKINNIFKNNY